VGLIFVSSLFGCGTNKQNDNTNKQNNQNNQQNNNETLIYLAVLKNENNVDNTMSDNLNCDNKDEVIAVKIADKKLSPQETLEKLFIYKPTESQKGMYNVFEKSKNLKIEKLVLANDFAVLTLSKDLSLQSMCDEQRVRAQITKTLLQFDSIKGVDIFVGDEELSSYFSKINEKGL
jgi:hypothetical protein